MILRRRQAFEFTDFHAVPQPELLVFHANEKFHAQGRLTDEATRKFVQSHLAAFETWVQRFKMEPP